MARDVLLRATFPRYMGSVPVQEKTEVSIMGADESESPTVTNWYALKRSDSQLKTKS